MTIKPDFKKLTKLAQLIRYFILVSTTEAGSGHPTSSLSAVELMTALKFGGSFRANLDSPEHPNNDRLIFSKGHASPLFYSLYGAAGKISEDELKKLRKFGSRLEGHPTLAFPYTEAATGSLGQGLAVGVGMALNAKYIDKLPYRTYVLMGDSEMAEGSVWEAIQSAAYYKLDNLVGIIDVNRLGQRGQTMYGHDVKAYQQRISAFGWETIVVDGHSFVEIASAYEKMLTVKDKPVMIIARTIKGKGVSFIEDKDGWHGKALNKEELALALKELGEPDKLSRGVVAHPMEVKPVSVEAKKDGNISYPKDKAVATRRAYGNALVRIFPEFPNVVVLDGETSNSTFAEIFKKAHPERFFEMFIAEQNMAGVALGLSRRGKIPFCSTFAAFWTRAFDQIRMGQYSNANIKFVGSHAGASIGEDGSSQMGLEDIAMFRSVSGSVVLYPSDAVSCEKLVAESAKHSGIVYIRTTRKDTAILYEGNESFPMGGSKVLRQSEKDALTIIGAGVTLHEALAAHEELKKEGIAARVVDLYSVKPIDEETIKKAAKETKGIIVVEDHYAEGGLCDAVRSVFDGAVASDLFFGC
jgi:transketolase